MMRVISILLVLLISFPSIHAASTESPTDSVAPCVRFSARQLILPGTLIALGTVGAIYRQPSKFIESQTGMTDIRVDDYLQFAPLAGYFALDYCGLRARHSLTDRLIIGVTGELLTEILTQSCKRLVNESRPVDNEPWAFPSGHSARAFLGAELVRIDYGGEAGTVAYLAAGAVAVMRLTNHRHWLNDVVAGAGVGILCARAANWLLPFNRRWLGLEGKKQTALIVPSYLPADRGAALTGAIIF